MFHDGWKITATKIEKNVYIYILHNHIEWVNKIFIIIIQFYCVKSQLIKTHLENIR